MRLLNKNEARGDKRVLKYGGFYIIISVFVIVAVLALNILAQYLETNNGWRVDLTPNDAYSLNSNTMRTLADLEKDVIIYSFIPVGSEIPLISNLLEQIDSRSDRVTVKNVDPVTNPAKLRRFNTDTKTLSANSVVVADASDELGRFYAVDYSEMVETNANTGKEYFVLQQWLVSAFLYINSSLQQTVYFLSGHGEPVTGDTAETLFNRVKMENYNVEILDLSSAATLNEGDVVVALSPTNDLSEEESGKLLDFLDKKHGRFMLVASELVDDMRKPLQRFEKILDYFNIEISDGYVAETDSAYLYGADKYEIKGIATQSDISLAVRSANAPINLKESGAYTYKYGTGVNSSMWKETWTQVVVSSAKSVLVPTADYFEGREDVSAYRTQVQTVAGAFTRIDNNASGTEIQTTTKIVVFGSADFLSGANSSYLGNSNIFRNSINWLSGKEDADNVYIVGTDLSATYIVMSQQDIKVWFAVLVVAVPLLLVGCGVFVWVRRKNL